MHPKTESQIATLRSEHGNALKCYERALFFSEIVNNNDDDLYYFHAHEKEYIKAINRIYSVAGIMLGRRYYSVCKKYEKLYDLLISAQMILPDRGLIVMLESAGSVGIKFGKLAKDAVVLETSETSLEEFKWVWLGLHNICHLFMDEITHLSERVDQLQSLVNVHKADFLTRRSLKYAIWGIGIGAIFSLISIFVSLSSSQSKAFEPNFYMELGKASAKLAAIDQSLNSDLHNTQSPTLSPTKH